MTAIEWFYDQIKFTDKDTYNELYEQYQQALEMEKQQIMGAFDECGNWQDKYSDAEHYYNVTFKTNNQ